MKWVEGNIEGVVLKPAKKHSDPRGWLTEIYRSDEIPDELFPEMGYVALTHPGVTRGPHGHSRQTDIFGFIGPGNFRIKLWDNRSGSPTYGNAMVVVVGQDNPMIVVVPPGVVHGYTNVSDMPGYVLNFPNGLYAGKGRKEPVDEIRYEDSKNAEFSMS